MTSGESKSGGGSRDGEGTLDKEAGSEVRVTPRILGIKDAVIHPLVLLAACDHYNRVAKDTKKRVLGVLLGTRYKGVVDVTNSFAVPFEEDLRNPKTWYLDHIFLENMFGMFKKVNAKERIVGFYSTGPKIRENDLQIAKLFR